MLFTRAKTEDMPRVFATETRARRSSLALWVTSIVVQLVISTYWSRDAFALMLELTSAMALIPYLLVAGYALILATTGNTYEADRGGARARSAHRQRWPPSARRS